MRLNRDISGKWRGISFSTGFNVLFHRITLCLLFVYKRTIQFVQQLWMRFKINYTSYYIINNLYLWQRYYKLFQLYKYKITNIVNINNLKFQSAKELKFCIALLLSLIIPDCVGGESSSPWPGLNIASLIWLLTPFGSKSVAQLKYINARWVLPNFLCTCLKNRGIFM